MSPPLPPTSPSTTNWTPTEQLPVLPPVRTRERSADASRPNAMPSDSFKRGDQEKMQKMQKVIGQAPPAQPTMQQKVAAYYDKSASEYTLPDGTKTRSVAAFRMNWKDDSQKYQEGLEKTLQPKTDTMKRAIHMAAYGRASPEQVQMVTQAFVDKGAVQAEKNKWKDLGEAEFRKTYPNTPWPITDATAVKLFQGEAHIGVDCAGYVQQAFLSVHGGTRADYGFQSLGDEDLTNLKNNKHFKQVTPGDAKPGDLMILDKPKNDDVGHTVLIEDRHAMTDAERAKLPGLDRLAKPGDKLQVFVVQASFGGGENHDPTTGGVQKRTFIYNETTKKWGDVRATGVGQSEVFASSESGPYEHPMNGIFSPKGR
jgi:hypothetical protein